MHVHHYIFPPANGSTSEGVCACGDRIVGRNSMEDGETPMAAKAKKASAAAVKARRAK